MFPGAYIPELSEIVKTIDASNMELDTVFTHDKTNYYKTMLAWTDNFYAQRDSLYGILRRSVLEEDAQTIMRIWEFYLCGSRLVFNDANGYCYNVQILMRVRTRG